MLHELNNIQTEYEEYDIDTYFDPMDITEEQKEERKEAAEELWWVFLLLFALINASLEDGDLDYAFIYETFKDSFGDIVYKYSREDDYTRQYVNSFSQQTLDTTWNHIDFENPDSYWTSDRRAVVIAVNEANTILNYEELMKAIEEGNTHKTWVAEIDRKTRKDHLEMNGTTIPIRDFFIFPDCEMLMPHDELNGTAAQIVNCRCSTKYHGKSEYQNETMAYNPVVRDEKTAIAINTVAKDNPSETISAKQVINSPNGVYLSDNLTIKPRKLHEIEQIIEKAGRIVGTNGKTLPRIVLVSDTELGKSAARFNALENTIFSKVFLNKKEQLHSILHEFYHWDDAQQYISNGGIITSNAEFIKIISQKRKRTLDKMGITSDNVNTISDYADRMYHLGRYDEVYVEYRTIKGME